jgi:hypothetical protein
MELINTKVNSGKSNLDDFGYTIKAFGLFAPVY